MKKKLLIAGGLVLVLVAVNLSIARKEDQLSEGTRIFLELAPVDPRSLIQGDYMRLDYQVAQAARSGGTLPREGRLVVAVDQYGIAYFSRLYRTGAPLRPGEHLLEYKVRDGRVRVGSDAFYFEEGQAATYQNARYGELRVADDGSSVLVGLRDERLRPLTPSSNAPGRTN